MANLVATIQLDVTVSISPSLCSMTGLELTERSFGELVYHSICSINKQITGSLKFTDNSTAGTTARVGGRRGGNKTP